MDDFQKEMIERLTKIETKQDEHHNSIVERLDKTNGRLDKHDEAIATQKARMDKASGAVAVIGSIAAACGAGIIELITHWGKHGK
jgi:hypothetical protein